MKNNKFTLLPILLFTLVGCGSKTSSSVTTSSEQPISSSDTPSITSSEDVSLSYQWNLKNLLDGEIKEATFYVGEEQINVPYNSSKSVFEFSINKSQLPVGIKVITERYEPAFFTIDENTPSNIGDVSIDYPFVQFGSERYNSTNLKCDWVGYSTRGLKDMRFQFTSNGDHFVNSNNELHLYVNIGDTSTKLRAGDYLFKLKPNNFYVYDFGFVHDYADQDLFKYSVKQVGKKTFINFDINYTYLFMEPNEIIGVNYIEVINDLDISIPMLFDDNAIDKNDTTKYLRLDVQGDYFGCDKNQENPYWISKAKKAELTKGKDYSFADPFYNAHQEADDVYFSVNYDLQGLHFDFVGFGDFQDGEYFKLIIHNDIIDKNSWFLADSDVVINIYNNKTEVYYGTNFFFDVEDRSLNPAHVYENKTFIKYKNYFTMQLDIKLDVMTNVSDCYDDIYFMIVEFGNKVFYNSVVYNQNFFYKGVSVGDPADMIAYQRLIAPLQRVCTLTDEEKEELIGDRNISFANPIDVKFDQADDFYLKITRSNSGMSLDMIGFGDFCKTEIVTMVFHTSSIDGDSWVIQKDDKSLMFSQDQSMWVTGTTDYWVATRMTRGQKNTLNKVQYTRYDDYFTITLDIDYDEIGKGVGESTTIRMYAIEFGFGGVIYNSDPWTKAMRLNGKECGDPAFQNTYIAI